MPIQEQKPKVRKYPYLPKKLMEELLQMLRINIGGIPETGYHFGLIPNLKYILQEAGYGPGLYERIRNLDYYGEERLREILSDIDRLHELINR